MKRTLSLMAVILTLFTITLSGCNNKESDIVIQSDTKVRPVKEISSNKSDQVLNIDGVELKEVFKNFDEAHYEEDSVQFKFDIDYDECLALVNDKDYAEALSDYMLYIEGFEPLYAQPKDPDNPDKDDYKARDRKDAKLFVAKGYKVGMQSTENGNLGLFKWTDNKTKDACLNALDSLLEKHNQD